MIDGLPKDANNRWTGNEWLEKLQKEGGLDKLSTKQVYQYLAKRDPLSFCAYYRKLRGHPLIFNVSRDLTPESLKELRDADPKRYDNIYKTRLLRHRPFLVKPLRDQHPHKVYEKGRQSGGSELLLTEEIFFLQSRQPTERCKVIHTFPREKQMLDFAATRINPVFEETPRIAELLTGVNQTMLKQIGNGFLMLRSAWESGLGEGVDADMVVLDEKDRMKEGVEVAFRESLKSSAYGFFREVSTPSLPKRGIDVNFRQSDEQIWHVRCENGHEQEITYEDNVVQVKTIPLDKAATEVPPGSYEYQCRLHKCRKPLNRLKGRWVARHPDRHHIRGYHLPQTICPWISADELMYGKIIYKFYQLWANYCLGITAKGENILLTDEDFDRQVGRSSELPGGYPLLYQRTQDWQYVTAGIDWGHWNWLVLLGLNSNGRVYILYIDMYEDASRHPLDAPKRMAEILELWQPDMIVADAGYGKDRNAYLAQRFDPNDLGVMVGCQYNPSVKHSRTYKPAWGDGRVLIDKTMTLKVMTREIRDRKIGFPSLEEERVRLLIKHLKALAPLHHEEEGEIYEEISSTGDDHLAHALAYALLGMDRVSKGGRFMWDFA